MKKSFLSILITALAVSGCNTPPKNAPVTPTVKSGLSATNPLKNAYFGDLHLHTKLSFDAYLFGTQLGPEEAYQFARGETVTLLGKAFKRNIPLDFLAVTDHSEYIGVINTIEDPNSALSKSKSGPLLRSNNASKFSEFFKKNVDPDQGISDIPDLNQPETIKSAWKREIDAANKYYQPGKFTTFIGYEWSSMPNSKNLHRNVIFSGSKAPEKPFSSVDSNKPEELWTFLENSRKQGFDVLAIPHNANVSDGLMYDWNDSYGNPISEVYAKRRQLNEPLSEISQNKGQSETHPVLSPNDEQANYEIFEKLLTGPRFGKASGSYVREAYGRGLLIEQKVGTNPFKFGAVGGSDFHGALSASEESFYNGNITNVDSDAKKVLSPQKGAFINTLLFGSASLTGVWAEENTRESIFSALKRKEVFATTGTVLKFRFFGGWNYNQDILKGEDWVKKAYSQGVPMGSDLPAKPSDAKSPGFVIWSVKDPDGANLDRVQVVKVWVKDGEAHEKIFDVAFSGDRKVDAKTGKLAAVGNSVDLKTATYTNTIGSTELSTYWSDPEFDAVLPALYYIRVVEIPTPRWTTILAVKNGLPLHPDVAPTIQERGFSSPIWYSPLIRQ